MQNEVVLSDLNTGEWGTIKRVNANGQFRKRLMEMGFIENTTIYVEKRAPLNDPIEYVIKGYHISLRRNEAAQIVITRPENGDEH